MFPHNVAICFSDCSFISCGRTLFRIFILSVCASLSFGGLSQTIDSYLEPDKAFEIGEQLHKQFKDKQAMKYLKYAAINGSAPAAFLYGKLRQPLMSTVREKNESYFFIEKSARDGYLPALKWLYQHTLGSPQYDDWRRSYYSALILLGQSQPGKAFYLLADYYRHSDEERYGFYLSEAVKRKYPKALIEQAQRLDAGEGDYIVPSIKQERIANLYLQAAQTQNISAMRAYIDWLEEHQQFSKAFYWRTEALKLGDIFQLASLGLIYSQPTLNYEFIETNYAKSNLLLEKYIDTAGTERFKSLYLKVQQRHKNNLEKCYPNSHLCDGDVGELKSVMNKSFLY